MKGLRTNELDVVDGGGREGHHGVRQPVVFRDNLLSAGLTCPVQRCGEGKHEDENQQGQVFHGILLTYVWRWKMSSGVRKNSTGTADSCSYAKIILWVSIIKCFLRKIEI